MTIETATYLSDLNSANPGASDAKAEGDDHMRLIKATVKATFPNFSGPVTATHTAINKIASGLASVTNAFNTSVVGVYLGLTGTTPELAHVNPLGVADSKIWGNYVDSTSMHFRLFNDAQNLSQDWLVINRTANAVTSINFPQGPVTIAGTLTITGGLVGGIAWTAVTGKPTNVSAFTNDAGYITTVGAVSWAAVTGKPTVVSYFTNDAGYLTGVTTGQVTTALGFTPYNSTNPSGFINSAGTSANCSGNAATATSAVSVSGATSNGYGTRTVSTAAPTGGVDGDVWFQY